MGFRSLLELGGVAGAHAVSKRLALRSGAPSATYTFALSDSTKRWRFYRLNYAVTYSAQGHPTAIAQGILVVKMLDYDELLPDTWRAELQLAVPPTEIRNAAMAGVGFDVPGGVVFPVGADAKILCETTTDASEWGASAFQKWSARIAFTVLAREVSR